MNIIEFFESNGLIQSCSFRVVENEETITYDEVRRYSLCLAMQLQNANLLRPERILLAMKNDLEWIIADHYCLLAGITEVCIPLSFSSVQVQSLIDKVDLVLVDEAGLIRINEWIQNGLIIGKNVSIELVNFNELKKLEPIKLDIQQYSDPVKIIHTSGSTSAPKGVMISGSGLVNLMVSLDERLPNHISSSYFSIIPLSLLIEQVAVYLTMYRGGEVLLPGKTKDLLGEGKISAVEILEWIREVKPSSMAIPPSVAKVMYDKILSSEDKVNVIQSLFSQKKSPYFSCGGAPVSIQILTLLRSHQIEIYEGYGLSENSSVVSINIPSENKIGTVGKALKHVEAKVAGDGELLIKSSSLFMGYSNTDSTSCQFNEDGWLYTGDLAEIDADGYIKILGRKKNVIITSNGRNIAPEWVENEFEVLPHLDSIIVFNRDAEYNEALVFVKNSITINEHLSQLESVNKSLQAAIQIKKFHLLPASKKANYFTLSGKPNRDFVKIKINNHEGV